MSVRYVVMTAIMTATVGSGAYVYMNPEVITDNIPSIKVEWPNEVVSKS